LREGDTFVVWRLDRLAANLADLVRLIAELETRKIHFESLTEDRDALACRQTGVSRLCRAC